MFLSVLTPEFYEHPSVWESAARRDLVRGYTTRDITPLYRQLILEPVILPALCGPNGRILQHERDEPESDRDDT